MKSKPSMTLDRVVSRMGLASRTAAREAIRAGRLKVNGRVVRDPEIWVQPAQDAIHFDGRRLKAAHRVYLLFYKPRGVITSHGDPQGRPTVYDCLARPGTRISAERSGLKGRNLPSDRAEMGRWVFPVGRLDKDTSGLLLLTNDTEFADFVTNPESRVPKTYLVKASGLMSDEVVAQLSRGVKMKRGDRSAPLRVRRLEDRGKYTWLEVVLTGGKNREVRRLVEAVGFKVLKLVRTGIGALTLAGLNVGQWRELTRAELPALKAVGRRSAAL
jgi:23S rRNA pseudouridine2605 synthase